MVKSKNLLSKQEQQEIETILAEVESRTSGEIVPVIAATSGRYDRAEDLFGLLSAIVLLSFAWMYLHDFSVKTGDFIAGSGFRFGLPVVIIILVLGYVLGAALATRFPLLRLPFIPRREMEQEVDRRAAEAFYRFGIGNTSGATGVLIYISLYERMVAVKGDLAISAKLSQSDWEQVCGAVVAGLKAKSPARALAEGIRKAGDLLATHFPVGPTNSNELRNEIYFVD